MASQCIRQVAENGSRAGFVAGDDLVEIDGAGKLRDVRPPTGVLDRDVARAIQIKNRVLVQVLRLGDGDQIEPDVQRVRVLKVSDFHWLNRKNFCAPEMEFVTVLWPLATTGAGETAFQASAERFVVDCKIKPLALAGHVKIISVPESAMLNCGCESLVKPAK